MKRLRALLVYFIKSFSEPLSVLVLMKLVYLFEYQYYQMLWL